MSSAWSVTSHYENFPVGSLLLPAAQRAAVEALYRFARYADDVADEGDARPAERAAELAALDEAVQRMAAGAPADHPAVEPLAPHVAALSLPTALLRDLLSAFAQDAAGPGFDDLAAMRDYTRRSAEPVGRLVLRIAGVRDPLADRLSDRICSALQMINFAQDFAADWRRGRLYVPLDEWRATGIDAAAVDAAVAGCAPVPAGLPPLLRAQVARARALLVSGAALPARLPRRLGWEVRAVMAGGLRVCTRLDRDPAASLGRPVRLGAADGLPIAATMLRLGLRRTGRTQPA